MKVLKLFNQWGPIFALVLIYFVFVLIAPESFATLRSAATILRQTTIVGIASLGMTLVIISGGIDLSVGSVVAFSTVVIATALQMGFGSGIAVLAAIFGGIFWGLINGLVITRLKVAPFIVTLGTLLMVRGVAKGFAHEQKVDAPLCGLMDLLAELSPDKKWMLFPSGVWLLIVLAFLTHFLLKYTKFGRHVFAIGSNEQTARLCGVAVDKTKLIIYTLVGIFASIAGLIQFSRLTVGDPTVAAGLELDVIASVVIGGGSLSGGEGTILGTLVGSLIMTVIRAGCSQMGLSNWVQEIITGIVIVIAVGIDRFRQKQL